MDTLKVLLAENDVADRKAITDFALTMDDSSTKEGFLNAHQIWGDFQLSLIIQAS